MQNDMRDRLFELLKDTLNEWECNVQTETLSQIADHLIANGVIVPPCKVGDTVYYIHETYWDKNYKDYIQTEKLKLNILQIVECPDRKTNLMLETKEFNWDLFDDWLNGCIFLTKEQAEQKLKEMRADNG